MDFYKPNNGPAACTPCPDNSNTEEEGSTEPSACVCAVSSNDALVCRLVEIFPFRFENSSGKRGNSSGKRGLFGFNFETESRRNRFEAANIRSGA